MKDRHPFDCLFSKTTWVSQHQKGKTNLDEAGDNVVPLALAGPYVNHLPLVPDR